MSRIYKNFQKKLGTIYLPKGELDEITIQELKDEIEQISLAQNFNEVFSPSHRLNYTEKYFCQLMTTQFESAAKSLNTFF